MFRIILLCLALSACAAHSSPPQPTGAQIPVNPSMWDYTGNEIFPAQTGN
jgi:hypothetical protein